MAYRSHAQASPFPSSGTRARDRFRRRARATIDELAAATSVASRTVRHTRGPAPSPRPAQRLNLTLPGGPPPAAATHTPCRTAACTYAPIRDTFASGASPLSLRGVVRRRETAPPPVVRGDTLVLKKQRPAQRLGASLRTDCHASCEQTCSARKAIGLLRPILRARPRPPRHGLKLRDASSTSRPREPQHSSASRHAPRPAAKLVRHFANAAVMAFHGSIPAVNIVEALHRHCGPSRTRRCVSYSRGRSNTPCARRWRRARIRPRYGDVMTFLGIQATSEPQAADDRAPTEKTALEIQLPRRSRKVTDIVVADSGSPRREPVDRVEINCTATSRYRAASGTLLRIIHSFAGSSATWANVPSAGQNLHGRCPGPPRAWLRPRRPRSEYSLSVKNSAVGNPRRSRLGARHDRRRRARRRGGDAVRLSVPGALRTSTYSSPWRTRT